MKAENTTPLYVVAAHIFWMMVGPLVLVLLGVGILNLGSGWRTGADIAFLVVLGGLIFARWAEFQGGNPQTSTGEPATRDHLRRYVILTLVIGLGIWVALNLVANYWL